MESETITPGSLLIILDGLGDRPCEVLGGKTPLESANTPCMDELVAQGQCGLVTPLIPGFPVSTHTGIAPLFGLPMEAAKKIQRGPVEAAGVELEMQNGDVLLRANFATFSEEYKLHNRRAGRIQVDTELLADSLNTIDPINGVEVKLKQATGHRGVVRLRGENISPDVSDTDPERVARGNDIFSVALNETSAAKNTASIINQWSKKAHRILKQHPVNLAREEQGLLPANGVILREAGYYQRHKNILNTVGVKPVVIAGEATILGLAKLFDFETIYKPSFTALENTDIKGKFIAAKQALDRSSLVIVHFKAPDICAHDLNPIAKKQFIEAVDKELASVVDSAHAIAITADHSTSSETGYHCGDPVPSLLYYSGIRRDVCNSFAEKLCMQGGINGLTANQLLITMLDGMGLMHNYKSRDLWMTQ